MDQQSFSVKTPIGEIKAMESPDKNNPGIVLFFIGNDGKERSACSMQFLTDEQGVKACVWGPERPDGDPMFEYWME